MIPPGARTQHPNGIRFTASDVTGAPLFSATYFSIGGGFIVEDGADVNAAPLMTDQFSALCLPQRRGAAGDGEARQPAHRRGDDAQ